MRCRDEEGLEGLYSTCGTVCGCQAQRHSLTGRRVEGKSVTGTQAGGERRTATAA